MIDPVLKNESCLRYVLLKQLNLIRFFARDLSKIMKIYVFMAACRKGGFIIKLHLLYHLNRITV